jgi:hypothetical protein
MRQRHTLSITAPQLACLHQNPLVLSTQGQLQNEKTPIFTLQQGQQADGKIGMRITLTQRDIARLQLLLYSQQQYLIPVLKDTPASSTYTLHCTASAVRQELSGPGSNCPMTV